MTKFYLTIKKSKKSYNIFWSERKSNPKIQKALLKDLMKLEKERKYE